MERTKTQTRRRLLTVAGGSVVALAGCLSSGDDDEEATTENETENENETDETDETDETESESESESADGNDENADGESDSAENDTDQDRSTLEHEGTEVPLVSLDEAYEWYEDDTHFVDARGRPSYEEKRIDGAVLSPAPDGMASDPVGDWDHDETIVTYCACPHSIAVRRSASLIEDGYENVFVLEGGLDAWVEEGHPVDGEAVDD
ncbi:rhodanese-like domain-containing protein [Halomontanus rarus]|uniref:rhodanese-like domain-containing protein n=1 Tax=Halomontanus rarus TaxID=3034020 RepID=UPI001A985C96